MSAISDICVMHIYVCNYIYMQFHICAFYSILCIYAIIILQNHLSSILLRVKVWIYMGVLSEVILVNISSLFRVNFRYYQNNLHSVDIRKVIKFKIDFVFQILNTSSLIFRIIYKCHYVYKRNNISKFPKYSNIHFTGKHTMDN